MLGNYGDTSNEGGGIIALRFIKEGLRIYIANIDKIIVILLNGGDKGSKAQQNKDIQTAKEYLKDFKERI
jgi:putative addiction module killer protein